MFLNEAAPTGMAVLLHSKTGGGCLFIKRTFLTAL
jgi:hypothetical protein